MVVDDDRGSAITWTHNVTLVILQSPDIILSQQTLEIENLIGHLASTINMEMVGTNDAFEAL